MYVFKKKEEPANDTSRLYEAIMTPARHSDAMSPIKANNPYRSDGLIPISQVNNETDDRFVSSYGRVSMNNPFIGKKIPKLSEDEMSVLEYCHNHDMIEVLKEEFRRNPINYANLEGGSCPTSFFGRRVF